MSLLEALHRLSKQNPQKSSQRTVKPTPLCVQKLAAHDLEGGLICEQHLAAVQVPQIHATATWGCISILFLCQASNRNKKTRVLELAG